MKTRIIGAIVAIVLAITGGLVLTGWVNGAESRAMAGARMERVYVVKTAIPANTPGEKVLQYLTVKSLPDVSLVPGRIKDLGKLNGLTSNTAIQPGEQLLAARFSDPRKQAGTATAASLPKSKQALSIALPLEQAVGGTLKAGDTVGVVIASDDEANKVHQATQKLHTVQVLSVESGTTLPSKDSIKATPQNAAVEAQMITLAVGTDAATQIVFGQKFGTVWLTLEQKTTARDTNKTVDAGTCTGSTCTPLHNGKATNDADK